MKITYYFSAMKPTARYTFSGVQSLSFTTHDINVRFQDGDSLSIDFRSGTDGSKLVHEECRDFLKWYGKRDMAELRKTYEALRVILEEEAKQSLEDSRKCPLFTIVPSVTARNGTLT